VITGRSVAVDSAVVNEYVLIAGAVEVVRVRAVRMQLWYAVVMRVQLWRG
jgi:hypothetical protein